MKTSALILVCTIILLFVSCKKEETNPYIHVLGYWLENTTLLDRESLMFMDNNTLVYTTRTSLKYVDTREFVYDLNSNHTMLFLTPVDDPDTIISCRINLNSSLTELSITGLNISEPTKEQKFIKIMR